MIQSSAALSALDGAVGEPVPSHYGNPLVEQRRLAEGAAVVQLARGVLQLNGPDRLSWLDSLTSQRLNALQAGDSAETLLLDPNGRIEYAPRIVDDGQSSWLIVETAETEGLLQWLERMRFRMRVELSDRSEDFIVLGSLAGVAPGEAAQGESPPAEAVQWQRLLAVSEGVPLRWVDPWAAGAEGGHQYARGEHPGAQWSWSESLIPIEAVPRLLAMIASGAVQTAGTLAAEALRIAAWRPSLGRDVDERSIPHELDWLRSAVHLHKGCYRGQETVAKVHNLGRPPRRLVFLHLDGSDAVQAAAGDAVSTADGTQVGTVTSAALHYELGPIALAVIRRGTAVDAPLTVTGAEGSLSAAQETIVPPDAGRTAPAPKLSRRGPTRR